MSDIVQTLSTVKNYNSQKIHYEAPYLTNDDMENIEYALEKQIPKMPVEQATDEKTHYKCECGYIMLTVYASGYRLGNQPKYCHKCGQKLDWSEEHE